MPDAKGNLVNSAGYYLMGNTAASGQADAVPTEKVNVTASGDLPTATTAGTLSVNSLDGDRGHHRGRSALGQPFRGARELHRRDLGRRLR